MNSPTESANTARQNHPSNQSCASCCCSRRELPRVAYMPQHVYIFTRYREPWSAASREHQCPSHGRENQPRLGARWGARHRQRHAARTGAAGRRYLEFPRRGSGKHHGAVQQLHQGGGPASERSAGSRRWLLWALACRSSSCCRPDCQIYSAIIHLHSSNRARARTCPPTFGSQGSQATLPDEREARVMR